jgi:DNA-binding NarL/FixJ family response regulator
MSETLTAVIFDATSGQVIERPLNAEELAQRELDIAEYEAQKAEAEAKTTARESALAKLAALGLTADEVAAL